MLQRERPTADLEILKLAKKRRRVIIREANYWACEDLVHRGFLNKSYPKNRKVVGWPEYKISKKGKAYLENTMTFQRQLNNDRNIR